ncbi:MAG: hypothetical protein SPI34_00885 [Opitutales bacterium]|nr:hypothetical protein [Opitutales bacterium]
MDTEIFCHQCGFKTASFSENNTKLIPYDWVLVFLFASYFVFDQVFLYFYSSNKLPININMDDFCFLLSIGYIIINSIVAIIDEIQLKNKLKAAPSAFFALFLVPVYLFKRGTITKKGRYSFWAFMVIWVIMLLLEYSPMLFDTQIFTPNYQKIETLKSIEFTGTNMMFDDFLKNKASLVKYSTFSNETGDYVSVSLKNDNRDNSPEVIYYFRVTKKGEFFSFLLSYANITLNGRTWETLNQNIADILLFKSDKTLISVTQNNLQNPISLLSDSEKIEILKSIRYEGMNSSLDEYIKNWWPNAKYEALYNHYKDYVSVTVNQKSAGCSYPEKVVFYFSIGLNKDMELISQLDYMAVHYKGKEPLIINNLFCINFFLRPQDSDIMKTTVHELQPFILK